MDDQCARKGNSLLLPSRQLSWHPIRVPIQPDEFQSLRDALVDLGGALAPHPEAEGHVLKHRHVRKERIALKDHTRIPPVWRALGDVALPDADLAGRGFDKAGDHTKSGGLPTAARAEQRDELAVVNVE